MFRLSRIVSAAAMALSVAPAFAVTFEGTAVGSWGNVVNGGTAITITNDDVGSTADFDFGSGTPSNLFTFDGKGSDADPGWSGAVGDVFRIGDFSYRNGLTTAGTAFGGPAQDQGGVTLSIALQITSPTALGQSFSFPFAVTLTPNLTGDPVADGDIVQVLAGITTTSFSFGGSDYTLRLLGFSTDNGNTITSVFNSPENSTALAGMYAQITEAIPAPGTLALLALGLTGVALQRRRPHASA